MELKGLNDKAEESQAARSGLFGLGSDFFTAFQNNRVSRLEPGLDPFPCVVRHCLYMDLLEIN